MLNTYKNRIFSPALAVLLLVSLLLSACSSPLIPISGQSTSTPEPTPVVHTATAAVLSTGSEEVSPMQVTETPIMDEATATMEATAVVEMDFMPSETPMAAGVEDSSGSASEFEGEGPGAILPEITVVDQTLEGEQLYVPYVYSLGEGWLVLHYQNPDGTIGHMVGATRVHDGENSNILVPVDTGLVTPTIYAMLHFDRGVRGSLEFPGPDVPILLHGEILAPSFQVTMGEGQQAVVVIGISQAQGREKHLVNGEGMSLYISLSDEPGQTSCTGNCLDEWKPVLVGQTVTAGDGVSQDNLGTITLPDGTRQVTYLDLPLYTYINDKKPGDANGEGIDGNWFLVAP